MKNIEKGSIEFILDGSEEDLQCLADLYESGELQTLLNELKPEHIPEIVVKKAEFVEDSQIIEKAQLIKAIREEALLIISNLIDITKKIAEANKIELSDDAAIDIVKTITSQNYGKCCEKYLFDKKFFNNL